MLNSAEIGLDDAKKSEKDLVSYYQSWSEQWTSSPQQMQLANIAPYVKKIVSFMQPDANYKKGSYNFTGTGLQFAADAKLVKMQLPC